MTRSTWTVMFLATIGASMSGRAAVRAQSGLGLDGRWTLDRSASLIPKEIGFAVDGLSAEPSSTGGGGGRTGGRGRRASSGGGSGPVALPTRPESAEDGQRMRLLLGEVRTPSPHVTIRETGTAIIITDDNGLARTFHPTGREEVQELDRVSVGATAKNEADRLSVVYSVEEGRTLRYIYHHAENPARLIVDVDLLGRGGGDKATLVYEPASATEVVTPASASAAVPDAINAPFNQKPGAELAGLTSMGLVVEDLSSEAVACGLNQSMLEAAVSKRLSDAGFKVRRNSDEDTYAYVRIVTTNPSGSLCVSRYDVDIFSHVTARLSYQQRPVLVLVSLLHKGGLAGGSPAGHGAAVLRSVQEYVDQFSAQIRAANK